MSLLKPGSTGWLLRHELRLTLRSLGTRGTSTRGAAPIRSLVVLGIGFLVLGGLVGLPLGMAARFADLRLTPSLSLAIDVGCLAVTALMMSQTLAAAVNALFVRGDLELLLSSPMDGRKVLAVRGVVIAMTPLLIYGSLALAAVGPAAAMGRPQWLAVLPLLAALSMLASSAGIGLALGLFALIGPRATRTVGQVLAAVIGASVFLLGQTRRFSRDGGGGMVPRRHGPGRRRSGSRRPRPCPGRRARPSARPCRSWPSCWCRAACSRSSWRGSAGASRPTRRWRRAWASRRAPSGWAAMRARASAARP